MTYQLQDEATMDWIDGELCIFNHRGDLATVDKMGSYILSTLLSGETKEHVVEKLAAQYDVETKDVLHDIDGLLSELQTKSFLKTNDE